METDPAGRADAANADTALPPVAAEPPSIEPPLPPELAPEGYAPGVERLLPPSGASRTPPDPILGNPPSGIFLFFVTFISFVSDISSKLWAEKHLAGGTTVVVLKDHLQFVLAKNRGGAWGLLQKYDENVRRPFFLLVSLAAIIFIITLYRRLQPNQRALRWGLPLVLGGALGNVFDRIRYGHVIDFVDYHAEWIRSSYTWLDKVAPGQYLTDHWPTFNVADVAICVGVGLMAVDMFTSKRGRRFGPRASVTPIPSTSFIAAEIPAETSPVAPSGAEASDPKTEEIPAPITADGNGDASTGANAKHEAGEADTSGASGASS